MSSFSTSELRSGVKVLLDGDPYSIVENEFVKPGKGQAFNRVKVRNLKTGRVMVKDEDVCLHCGLCAERCPTGAWDMQKFLLDMTHAGTSCRPPRRSAA